MTAGPDRLPPRRRLPAYRKAAMRHVLEGAVAHDHHPRRWRWSRRGAVLLASAGLALAGGGAAAYALSRPAARPPTSAPGTSATTGKQTGASTSAKTAPKTSGSGSTTTTAVPPVCAASQLTFTVGQMNGAMGTVSYPLVVRNASAAACNLYGYPGMQMLTATGSALQTQVVRNDTMFGLPPEQMVVLAPGAQAFFAVAFSDGTGYTGLSCPTSARVEITPPNAYTPATITWQIAPYPSGDRVCGTVQVSYAVAGTPNTYM